MKYGGRGPDTRRRSVQTTATSNPDALAVFGAERTTDGAATVMIINKVSGSTPVTLSLANFSTAGYAQVWQLTSANTIARLPDVTFGGSALSLAVPSQSLTLLVVPSGGGPAPTPPAAPTNLTATAATNRLVTSRWSDASSTESGFSIERAEKAKTLSFSVLATTGANVTTWQHTSATGQWVYRVRAFNAVGNSGYSNTATVRVR